VDSTVQLHPPSIIQSFTDVREVFQSNHWVVELAGVLDSLPRRLFNNLCECVLRVVKSFVNPPLGGIPFLSPLESREYLFAEVSRSSARASASDVAFEGVIKALSPPSKPMPVSLFRSESTGSSSEYSTVTCNFHDIRCFCRRSLPAVASSFKGSDQRDSCSGLIHDGIQKFVLRSGCGACHTKLYSHSLELSNFAARLTNRSGCLSSSFSALLEFRSGALECVFGLIRQVVGRYNVVDRRHCVRPASKASWSASQ
jgi:hypothetical protein